MSPVYIRNFGIQRKQLEDREGVFRTRRPGRAHHFFKVLLISHTTLRRGHLGHSCGWQDTEENHTQSSIHLPIRQKPQTRGLEGYGSTSSAPQTPQRSFPMEHGQQEVQPSIPL
ncbi:hypothetical protein O181_040226 [Austropuccinia psidii MF-1]|uniref:Uncharacterized protein n=1 Tax=Austropuccinia psidii MF-1 TaxID=1389203 RepID=A0A9Q3DHE2_9BASI|nr:hypothetical protein [Austropuccinia psidii MF-1]